MDFYREENSEGFSSALKFLLCKSPSNFKYFLNFFDPFGKSIHFLFCIVNIKTRPGRRFNPQKIHQWLCAMVAGTDCNALGIQNRSYIMGMHIANIEAYYSAAFFRVFRTQ